MRLLAITFKYHVACFTFQSQPIDIDNVNQLIKLTREKHFHSIIYDAKIVPMTH